MLEKIKEVPFIDESTAVKVTSDEEGKVVLERYDRVIWAREVWSLREPVYGLACYVEASKLLSLLEKIVKLEQTTCLVVTLDNGARYELPFLPVSWEPVEMPNDFDGTVEFDLADLMLSTLKNLIKPELQCIYIDEHGAVSCDFITACISKKVRFSRPFLLPPDVQALVDGKTWQVKIGDKLYLKQRGMAIVAQCPMMNDDGTWEQLRSMLPEQVEETSNGGALSESLKRLAVFGDYVSFDGTKVVCGSNFEPFEFANTGELTYEIEKLMRILSTAPAITEHENNLICSNANSTFLMSPMDEA